MDAEKDAKLNRLNSRVVATAIVNHAVIRCQVLGLPVTEDNVVLCISDFFDPTDPDYSDILEQLDLAITSTFHLAGSLPDLH